jgi:hypothetical protein
VLSPPPEVTLGTQIAAARIMRRHLNLGRVFITVPAVVGTAIMVVAPAPVEAATVSAPEAKSYGSVKSGQPYDWIEACDKDRDGHGVFVECWTRNGGHAYVWDGNGSKPNCGNAKVYGPDKVTSFRVCVEGAKCSDVVKL